MDINEAIKNNPKIGTRAICARCDSELPIVGIYYDKFPDNSRGICLSISPCERCAKVTKDLEKALAPFGLQISTSRMRRKRS